MSARLDSTATQEKIMDAMLELARKTPLGQITVNDICLACGISRKTFYTYFPNKYELLQEIFRRRMNRPLVEMAGRSDQDIKEEYIERYLDWANFLKANAAFIRSTYDTDQWSALERILLHSSLEVVTKQVENYLGGKAPMTPSVRRKLWFYVCGGDRPDRSGERPLHLPDGGERPSVRPGRHRADPAGAEAECLYLGGGRGPAAARPHLRRRGFYGDL